MTDNASEEPAQLAREQAKQAASQAKHAGKNAGRAAKAGAEAAAEVVVDEARDAADRIEATAEEAVSVARRLGYAGPDLALAAFGLAVTVYSGRNAYAKFRAAS